MSQTPSSAKAIFPTGQFDIGPGGVITDSPANLALLELIENTPALLPVELYTLAVSYQRTASNSGLGNRLAFIALDNIFLYPQSQQDQAVLLQKNTSSIHSACCFGARAFMSLEAASQFCGCDCGQFRGHGISTTMLKGVSAAGLDLLVEVTQVDETKNYVVLGVSPSVLTPPDLPVQVQGSDTSSDETPEQPQNQ